MYVCMYVCMCPTVYLIVKCDWKEVYLFYDTPYVFVLYIFIVVLLFIMLIETNALSVCYLNSYSKFIPLRL
jgi:hypothetical protein